MVKACCVPEATIPKASHQSAVQAQTLHPDTGQALIKHDFIELAGGWFNMGANDGPHPQDGEGPVREVFVDPFALAKYSVTYAEFSRFVQATSYVTVAERLGSSFVFFRHLADPDNYAAPVHTPWWRHVDGANWRYPYGPDSQHEVSDSHPVVHIAQEDALAFCYWSSCRLPTEAEWELAARAGLDSQPYPWGDMPDTAEQPRANTWRGEFPTHNERQDGLISTVPVMTHAPNAFGLFNMTGNVWERVADRFTHMHSPRPTKNPKGPLNGKRFVGKGGSYLCHASYCYRYRTSSRQALAPETTADNVGFRVARDCC